MSILIDKEKTCAVSGHRILDKDFDAKKLKENFLSLINSGYENFLIGMAIGFDSVCFKTLESLRKEYKIKIIACVPCKNQSEKFSLSQKIEYDRQIKSADEVIILEEKYVNGCMQKRNRFLVDNASVLLCYLKKEQGGTAYTYNYAIKNNIKTIKI